MGSVDKMEDLTVIARNSDHVSQFLDMILLGLYVIGEKDVIGLRETTFIKAN